MTQRGVERLKLLDGWRAVSILAVLAGHLLPLGPHRWLGNDMVARFGMSIFFVLSGFLIVSILWRDQHVGRFLARRLARIVPLAWLAVLIVFSLEGAPAADWLANLFFYANLPPQHLDHAGHFWSLGVEMQFYLGIAVVVAAFGRRGLWLVPPVALAITLLRICAGMPTTIVTLYRVDDILAGGCLALIHLGPARSYSVRMLAALPFWPVCGLALAACHADAGALAYARPYLAATMVGALLYQPGRRIRSVLESRSMGYIARISYALYIIHPFTVRGWLGDGDTLIRYCKRPLAIALTFFAAHVSTFRFERSFIRWSHRGAQPRNETVSSNAT
ncbi:acyltransferase family protein [Rhizorhabdus argentea]|uniref:acyltransferase family protein n=1 Tax=Rhizorhabdus argentea TaxID=1387174 RepID=UPI0030EE9D8E